MKDKTNLIGIILILLSFSLVVYLFLEVENTLNNKIENTLNKIESPLYERVINRFAETHEYNKTSFNCVNYSENLAFILENLGYQTSQEKYIKTETGFHRRMNLILEIEPQTSEIIVNRK